MRHLAWTTLLFVLSWGANVAAQEEEPGGDDGAEPAAAETPPTPPAEVPEPAEESSAEAATGDDAVDAAPAETNVAETPPAPEPAVETRQALTPVADGGEAPPTASSVLSDERIRAPIVEYRTAWGRGVGFLMGDKRTVVALGNLRDRYRRITVKMAHGEGPEVRVASVELSTNEETPFVLLHLEGDLDGTPLELSEARPGVGDRLFLILRSGPLLPGRDMPGALEPAETVVTAASTSTLTVGTARSQLWHGSPVFDPEGRVVAFVGSETHAVRADHILGEENLRSGRSLISPIFGLRVGTEFGGFLSDPFVLDIELGLSIWDQLGIIFRFGIGIGDEELISLPALETRGSGVVEADRRTIGIGLELKYRLLLTRAAMPLYIDIVAGLQYTNEIVQPRGMAVYYPGPDCDPDGVPDDNGCNVIVGEPPGQDNTHGVGPVFGFDVRVGLFTMGYRFMAERISHQLPTTHRLTFGITYR